MHHVYCAATTEFNFFLSQGYFTYLFELHFKVCKQETLTLLTE